MTDRTSGNLRREVRIRRTVLFTSLSEIAELLVAKTLEIDADSVGFVR